MSTMIAQQPMMPLVAAAESPVSVEKSDKLSAAKSIIAERFKTKLCRNYIKTGVCPYEHRCMFAHGNHEMRTKQMNVADQITSEEAVKTFQRKVRAQAFAAASAPSNGSKVAPPGYSTYGAPTSAMGVLDEEEGDFPGAYDASNNSGSYQPQQQPQQPLQYADYEGPCMCDDCIRARAMPCQCAECAAAAAAAVCMCQECVIARSEQNSVYTSDNEEGMMMP